MKAQIIVVTKDFGEISGTVNEYTESQIQEIENICDSASSGILANLTLETRKDGIKGKAFIPQSILSTSLIFVKLEE